MKSDWSRRRWYDFRQGHGVYLIFAMSFANFILIFYRLLIERVDILGEIFSSLWIFIIFFVLTYIPVAVLIGNWHKKTQIQVDQEQIFRRNPYLAKSFKMIIDMLDGKATKEEIEKYRNMLSSIEKGGGGF